MKRLTKRDEDGVLNYTWEQNSENGSFDIWDEKLLIEQIDRLAAYEDTGLEPERIKETYEKYIEITERTYGPLHKKIGEWLRAEQDGRLVVLPCKVGDAVWFRTYENNGAVCVGLKPYAVTQFDVAAVVHGKHDNIDLPLRDFGKTVFLTREEAEATLE